jgi:hypothetical protein
MTAADPSRVVEDASAATDSKTCTFPRGKLSRNNRLKAQDQMDPVGYSTAASTLFFTTAKSTASTDIAEEIFW